MRRFPRRQRLQVEGFSAFKRGGPSPFADLYYSAMELSWPQFIGAAGSVFLVVNAMFGLVFAAMPGALLNAHPGSFLDGFFFSVETLATVGYGNMAPATYAAHAVATLEIMCGILLTATMTGLTFARFARPRQSIILSNVAVLGRYGGEEALMIRIASIRANPIADVTAQLGYIEEVSGEKGRLFRRVAYLELVRPRNAMLNMNWMVAHVLPPDSELRRQLRDPALFDAPFRLMLTVGGMDTMLAAPTFGGRFYGRADIRIDHEFIDMIAEDDGAFEVDLTKLHLTKARAG